MHILMIAPEPFFEPRGTPFSEFHRIRALITLGHTVDLVTYPFGRDVQMAGLSIRRCLRPPFVRHVRIGPSWTKVPLDLSLALSALKLALSRKYDAVHSHEEGGFIGVVLAWWLGVPHLYDMHSSLPQQVENFGYGRATWLKRMLSWVERVMIRRSRVVIVICQDLETTVRSVDSDVPTVLIENAPGSGDVRDAAGGTAIRAQLGLTPATPVVLYTGTFEAYQGLDLLFAAMSIVHRSRPDARLVLAGGRPEQLARAGAQTRSLGIDDVTIFAGERPAMEIPAFLQTADLLVSPRSRGTNTPLKIYQYLGSGKPIVATRLLTHTQVLNDETAILTGATPEEFANGMLEGLADPARAAALGQRAQALAGAKYSYEAYLQKTREACAVLAPGPPPGEAVKDPA